MDTMEDVRIVDVLIDAHTLQWDKAMIDGMFIPQEVEIIKKIPLACLVQDDALYWLFSQDGKYTCKSGYRFLKEEANQIFRLAPMNQEREVWRGVWSLLSPNKVKNQLQRVMMPKNQQ